MRAPLVWLITTRALAHPMVTIDCGKPLVPIDRLVCDDSATLMLDHGERSIVGA
jgi:hypothetical protein